MCILRLKEIKFLKRKQWKGSWWCSSEVERLLSILKPRVQCPALEKKKMITKKRMALYCSLICNLLFLFVHFCRFWGLISGPELALALEPHLQLCKFLHTQPSMSILS
jgi:hypothetical protein